MGENKINRPHTHSFVVLCRSLSPSAETRRVGGCQECRIPVKFRRNVQMCFLKLPGSQPLVLTHPIAALHAILSAVLNWTKYCPCERQGKHSHVGHTNPLYWLRRHNFSILAFPPLVNSSSWKSL